MDFAHVNSEIWHFLLNRADCIAFSRCFAFPLWAPPTGENSVYRIGIALIQISPNGLRENNTGEWERYYVGFIIRVGATGILHVHRLSIVIRGSSVNDAPGCRGWNMGTLSEILVDWPNLQGKWSRLVVRGRLAVSCRFSSSQVFRWHSIRSPAVTLLHKNPVSAEFGWDGSDGQQFFSRRQESIRISRHTVINGILRY